VHYQFPVDKIEGIGFRLPGVLYDLLLKVVRKFRDFVDLLSSVGRSRDAETQFEVEGLD